MITKKKIKDLSEIRAEHCVSIYIPTYRAGHNQEDLLRAKNAIQKAKVKLEERGLSSKEADRFLRPALQLLKDDTFWLRLSDGLALFISENTYERFILPHDVPSFTWVGKKFYLRHLLPAVSGQQRFFLLALSQNELRFFEGNKHQITPVIIEDLVPANLEEGLNIDELGNQLQAHSGNGQNSIFHGHDLGADHKLKRLESYLRMIDAGLMEMLHDEQAPLLIAAVDYLVPIYREISGYAYISDIHISGNPENDDPVLLHEKAWNVLSNFQQNRLDELKDRYQNLLHDRRASSEPSNVVRAAEQGKVETLFAAKEKRLFGTFYPEEQAIAWDERKEDLLERAALKTFLQGGQVFQLSAEALPDTQSPVSAIMRF